MKKIKTHLKIFSIFVSMAVVLVAGVTLLAQKRVDAAVCGTAPTSGSTGTGNNLYLQAKSDPVDSTTEKISLEFTPQQTWASNSGVSGSMGSFATSSCTVLNASLSFSINGNSMYINYYDSNRTAAFAQGTDYKDVGSGVSVTSSSNTSASANLNVSTINSGEAQTISVDISSAGWAEVLMKQGSGAEASLVTFKLPATAAAFYSSSGQMSLRYSPPNANSVSCTAITGTGEVKVRALANATPVGMSAEPKTAATCADYDVTSYDSGTKTASLKYTTVGKSPNHVFMHRYDNLPLDGEPEDNYNYSISEYTSLDASDSTYQGKTTYYPTSTFYGSKSASEEVYFIVQASDDNQVIPDGTPYPIVGAKYNFATADIDFGGTVKLDTSAELYASMAHNLATYTADGTFTLFAPVREGDQYVGVCPGAQSIDSVNTTCGDLYFLKEGETKNGATASIVTVGATKFWRVDGLSGTGVFSSTIGEIPGVANTGVDKDSAKIGFIILGLVGSVVVATQIKSRLSSAKRR